MQPDALWQRVQASLERQGMMRHLGALADIAGGYAGLTVAAVGMEVTTAEVAHMDAEGRHSACAEMQQTLVSVPQNY